MDNKYRNSFLIKVKLIIQILILLIEPHFKYGNNYMTQNYYYDYYPYFMNAQSIYPPQVSYPLNCLQKSLEKSSPQIKHESSHNLKIQQHQPLYIEAKQQQRIFSFDSLKKRRQKVKKPESDSFTQKRNIIPNNINHILAFLQRKSKSEKYAKKLIQKDGDGSNFTTKRFYCYQNHLKQKLHVHVNKQSLSKLIHHLDQCSQIFTVEEQVFYNRISRILIYFYLRETAKITILSSARVRQTNKKDHLIAQRELLNHVLDRDYA